MRDFFRPRVADQEERLFPAARLADLLNRAPAILAPLISAIAAK
jgi:hypothetical protein